MSESTANNLLYHLRYVMCIIHAAYTVSGTVSVFFLLFAFCFCKLFMISFTLSKAQSHSHANVYIIWNVTPHVSEVLLLHNFHIFVQQQQHVVIQVICFEIDYNVISRYSLFQLFSGWIFIMWCNNFHKSTWSM